MKITILGTGTFFVTTKRSGPAYLLETAGKKILIDCGPGTLMRLSQLEVNLEEIDYVFLTHFHPDHSSDLFTFQMNFRLKDFFNEEAKRVPVIYGPKGIENFTKELSSIYQLPAFDNYSKIKYVEAESLINLGDIKVKSYQVSHMGFGKKADALAYRFEAEGKVFVFSGGAIKDPEIEKAAKDADLFICDASYEKGKGTPAHMDTYEIGEISQKGKVKRVILTHFYPHVGNIDLAAQVKEVYLGSVKKGEDLEVIEV